MKLIGLVLVGVPVLVVSGIAVMDFGWKQTIKGLGWIVLWVSVFVLIPLFGIYLVCR